MTGVVSGGGWELGKGYRETGWEIGDKRGFREMKRNLPTYLTAAVCLDTSFFFFRFGLF